MRLILASGSPRRRELLRAAGIEFETRTSSTDEHRFEGEAVKEYVLRMAREKALAVAESAPAGGLVLGADTVVVVDGEMLGKPLSPEDAERMLRLLSGRDHRVITGVCLLRAAGTIEACEAVETRVWFRRLDEFEIGDYVASGEPFDKAGAYAIQGRAAKFVTRIEGEYSNVVGLPVARVYELLKRAAG